MRIFESVFRVRSHELDALGHVNHATYLNYFEQARYDALQEAGFSIFELARGKQGGVYVVHVEVDYLRECRFGQNLRVQTRAESFRASSMTMHQELFREGDDLADGPAVEARIVLVWVNERGRPTRIPREVRKGLSEV